MKVYVAQSLIGYTR